MTHTPGPWTIGEVVSLNSFPIMDSNNILLGYFNQSGNDQNEGSANAALIGAAADILTALRNLAAATEQERKTEDVYIRNNENIEAWEAYQDAMATTIICEHAARAAIALAESPPAAAER